MKSRQILAWMIALLVVATAAYYYVHTHSAAEPLQQPDAAAMARA